MGVPGKEKFIIICRLSGQERLRYFFNPSRKCMKEDYKLGYMGVELQGGVGS